MLSSESRDIAIAAGLVTAPAWVPPLSSINEVLTTLTLLLGIALGAGRMWLLFRRLLRERGRRD